MHRFFPFTKINKSVWSGIAPFTINFRSGQVMMAYLVTQTILTIRICINTPFWTDVAEDGIGGDYSRYMLSHPQEQQKPHLGIFWPLILAGNSFGSCQANRKTFCVKLAALTGRQKSRSFKKTHREHWVGSTSLLYQLAKMERAGWLRGSEKECQGRREQPRPFKASVASRGDGQSKHLRAVWMAF